ncbi:DUF6543 domain-containing protein [Pseudomonas alliivorans]|nr:DUF6543 domain-containing protein [Pseudomonas alliivorans]MEE4958421.1 DUF6543 domain-containing protein [Pseudomonas alliivorans]MEE4966283.1 DUF6543 domain-containing protein [Pseudomonas alliivorans]MEE4988975.1 DUF6543 domain-containing protein [Pseudomonas alliivorans]MEE4994195.1 DUF6543 domain-containing protein [Pseudomonas alliivorans]
MHSTTHNTPTTTDAVDVWTDKALKARAAALMGAYPDLYSLAFQAARTIIARHTDKVLDPGKVYWHRFTNADNSGRTFSGWEHVGPPSESMTLIELVMHRFSASDNVAVDEMNTYSGFYHAGPGERFYNEHNEVPVLPSDVLKDFWAQDFAVECKRKADAFWRDHGQDFCTFARISLLSSAGLAVSKKQLQTDDFETVLTAVNGSSDTSDAWAAVQKDKAFTSGVSLRVLELAGHASRDMLLVTDAHGRQILYTAGAQPAFQRFANEQALYQWLQSRVAQPADRAALVSHFVREEQQKRALGAKLAKRFAKAWSVDQTLIGRHVPASPKPVFEHLRDAAHKEMNEDIHHQLTSSASLRKQMWIGYLSAFIRLAGGVSSLAWPIALSLVGAGIASVGLNIDQAVNGRTAQLRKSGVLGAVLNSVYLLFNLPMLVSIGRSAELAPVPEDEAVALAGLEGNELLEDAPPAVGEHARGIHVLGNDQTWIMLGDFPYRVRYLQDFKTWAIVDPENPFAFNGARPVRLNELDEWELIRKPVLRGGNPPVEGAKPYITTSSDFWDTHMQFNVAEEQRLSIAGNHRQRDVINIYEMASDEEVVSDSEGEDVVIDAWQDKHRVFKTPEDDYYGGAITRYTEDDDAYNQFLRTGIPEGADQIEALETLVEDVGEIQHNNDVPLYRGGSGERGTSGEVFRKGNLKVGDVLVNTDITSFSENPYIARVFASSQGGVVSTLHEGEIVFDDTSVVFELPAKDYLTATPISPFSNSPSEVESLFLPGNYFEISRVEEVAGANYRFMNVQLRQVPVEQVTGPAYDLRTGELFSREAYAAKLSDDAKALVDTFFPPQGQGSL